MIYDDKKFIGKVVRNARKKARLNQSELSEKLCMSEKNLSNIENGRQYPQVNNFLRIIEVLNLTLKDFGVNCYDSQMQDEVKASLVSKILSSADYKIRLYQRALQLIDDTVV